jgi:ribosomal protein L40E
MEHSKLAKVSEHKLPIGHSPSSARKKAAWKKAESARPLRTETASKSKSEKLVCRYCGSDDLAPSFIKRRDRRCRKCFSKRYGSAAPARKAKIKKK